MTMALMWLILMGLFVLPPIGLFLLYGYAGAQESKRTAAMAEMAAELKLGFTPEVNINDFLQGFPTFALFSISRGRRVRNIMRTTVGDTAVTFFDFTYVTGRNSSNVHHHSAMLFQSTHLALPVFTLRPADLLDKMAAQLGYQKIDFDAYPAFSTHYLLRGPDEASIRDLFTDRILTCFEQNPTIYLEGVGDTLLFYRSSARRVRPHDLPTFLEEGKEVLSLFTYQRAARFLE